MEPPITSDDHQNPGRFMPHALVDIAHGQAVDAFAETASAPRFLLFDTRPLSPDAIGQLVARACDEPEDPAHGRSPLAFVGTALEDPAEALEPAPTGPRRQTLAELNASLGSRTTLIVPIRAYHPDHTLVTLGRSANADIPVRHPSISRLHAVLEYDAHEQLSIRELGSKNGTLINGEAHAGTTTLESGDALTFGRVHAVVVDAALLWKLLNGVTD